MTEGTGQVGGGAHGLLRKEATESKELSDPDVGVLGDSVITLPGKWVGFGLSVELDWDVVGGLDQVKDG